MPLDHRSIDLTHAPPALRAEGDPIAEQGATAETGCYAFCVAPLEVLTKLTGELDYVVAADLGAVIGSHPGPLQTEKALHAWVQHHAAIVQRVWEISSDVIPLQFGTIFKGETEAAAHSLVRRWLDLERERLADIMARIHGCEEYGVAVSYDQPELIARLADEVPELAEVNAKIGEATAGQSYLLRIRLHDLLARHLENYAAKTYRWMFERISGVTRGVCVDRLQRHEQPTTDIALLKLSCLVACSQTVEFFRILTEDVERASGSKICVTGPWPPYSFVS
ncbi:MAG: GvpL/GvpF family gas vesicle protein [Cyanobacteria bacterium NC_groundwater_1444_Ag_S-0.65um_54_12]|nr:GvpL/GvpF family gas vesicle protein [Cyanobacteria bacterium NC_groundwater_1444_Ag_S-0.65um_54_12]